MDHPGQVHNAVKARVVVLISGNGTNLQSLIDASQNGALNCEIVLVVSNRKAAYGLVRAQNAGIPTRYHNLVEYKKRYPDNVDAARLEYDSDLAKLVLEARPRLVVTAGWMHILADTFLTPLSEAQVSIINLHPALPGQFNGVDAIPRAHQAWMDGKIDKTDIFEGIMIHYVISEVDMGDPVIVEEIPFITGVDEDITKLEERVHMKEWQLIVQGTAMALSKLPKKV